MKRERERENDNKKIPLKIRIQRIIKEFLPPIFIILLKKILNNKYIYFVAYKTWEQAEKASHGYDADNIIEKVKHSSKLVFEGKAIFERDSKIFNNIEYSYPLLASLLFVASNCKSLRVIDFGGALGTTFQQNRKYLLRLKNCLEWRIVEQQKFVSIGNKEFTNKYLSFYNTIEEATKNGVDVVIFCGSICYVPNAYHYLKAAIDTKAPYIIFDRTPITMKNLDTFAVQHVPSNIYKATLPLRIFSYNRFVEQFKSTHNLLEEWLCGLQLDNQKEHEKYMGFIFERRFY